ncbi:zinc knuckle CX2CX4HX4C containing protein [Tanacetum coccineum]
MESRRESIVGEDSIRIVNSFSKVIDEMNKSTTNHAARVDRNLRSDSDSAITVSLNPKSGVTCDGSPKLITDIEAGKHDELLSEMTNDDHMETLDALGTICNSIQANNINADVIPCKVSHVDDSINLNVDKSTILVTLSFNLWTSIPSQHPMLELRVQVKLHDVPIQVFKEDGISLIATFIGKPVMLDSYTSSMCNDSWGRSSFAWCLIEVNLEADLVDVVTIGIPSLSEDDFTKETIRVEYEWRPPRCDTCKIFGHVHDYCPKKVVSPPIVATSNVVTPNAEKTNDGFQTVGKKKKRKGKSKSTNGGQFTGPLVKHNVRYEPKATTSAPMKGTTYVGYTSQSTPMLKTTGNSSKKDNLSMSNSFSALNEEEEEDEEEVENVYDESANLIHNTKAGGSSSFTAAAG